MNDAPIITPRSLSSRQTITATSAIIILALLAAVPLILHDYERGRAAYDQNTFHLVAIRQFAQQWPHINLSDYPSATTPGYHLIVAAVDRYVSPDLRILRLAGAGFSLALLGVVTAMVASKAGFAAALVLCLPLACSSYVFASMTWLLPDNAGWLCVVWVLWIAIRPRVDGWTYLLGGLAMLAVVAFRQNHLWVAVPLCISAWYGTEANGAIHKLKIAGYVRFTKMIVAIIPALILLAMFALLWRGMSPPSQRMLVGGFNFSAPAMTLATAGVLGIFFIPILSTHLRDRQFIKRLAIGILMGAAIGIVPRTSYNLDAGRYSGIWIIARHTPIIFDRSPMMVLLAAFGGAFVSAWLWILPIRERWIWGSAALAFGISRLATHNAFQRYDEPMILIALAISLRNSIQIKASWTWIAPLVLSGLLITICVLSVS